MHAAGVVVEVPTGKAYDTMLELVLIMGAALYRAFQAPLETSQPQGTRGMG